MEGINMDNDSSNKPDKQATPEQAAPAPAPAPAANPAAPAPQSAGGLAIAALIVGIVAIIFFWAPFFGFVAGAAAVVLGIIAIKKAQNKGMSIAGIITGGIATLINLIFITILLVGLAAVGGAGVQINDAINEANKANSFEFNRE